MKRLSLNPHKNSSLTACRVHDSMIENRGGSKVFQRGVDFQKVFQKERPKKPSLATFERF